MDASGVLPEGKIQWRGGTEDDSCGEQDAFAECLTEKLMIYALGRGLEGYDRARYRRRLSPGWRRMIIGFQA